MELTCAKGTNEDAEGESHRLSTRVSMHSIETSTKTVTE